MESPLSATLPLSQTSNSDAGDSVCPSGGGLWRATLLRSDDDDDDCDGDDGGEDAYAGLVEDMAMDGPDAEHDDEVLMQRYYGDRRNIRKLPLEEPKAAARSAAAAMKQRLRRLVADEDCQDPAFYSMALHALGGKGLGKGEGEGEEEQAFWIPQGMERADRRHRSTPKKTGI